MRQRQCRGLQAAANSPTAAAAPSRVGKAGQPGEEARGQGEVCSAALHTFCTQATIGVLLDVKIAVLLCTMPADGDIQ